MTSIVLEWNEIIHQKFRHFSTFSWFYSAKVLVCKTDWNIKRANVARKINFFYFFLYGVIDQLHRSNPAKFQVFDLAELVLRLFIENTSKSNWIHSLQTVWSVKLISLRKFRIANITFLKPQMYTRTRPFACQGWHHLQSVS